MERFLNKDCMIMFVCAIVGVVIFFWMIYPRFMSEQFNGIEAENNSEIENNANAGAVGKLGEPGTLEQKPPHVDPKTGIIMDGPGFEKGEIDGAYVEGPTGVPSNYYFLDDGAGGEFSIQHNLCSPSCCSESWPDQKKFGP